MVIYYRGPSAHITHEMFEVWCTQAHRRYRIRELRNVYVVRTRRSAVTLRGAAGAGAVVVGAATVWPFLHTPAAWLTATGALVVSMVVGGACWRPSSSDWELRATYRNRSVVLFRCRDDRTFGQVKRALQRAVEGATDR
jgi:Family of unknown function (DUF6232)